VSRESPKTAAKECQKREKASKANHAEWEDSVNDVKHERTMLTERGNGELEPLYAELRGGAAFVPIYIRQ